MDDDTGPSQFRVLGEIGPQSISVDRSIAMAKVLF